jgi:hypothetical protein
MDTQWVGGKVSSKVKHALLMILQVFCPAIRNCHKSMPPDGNQALQRLITLDRGKGLRSIPSDVSKRRVPLVLCNVRSLNVKET